MGQLANNEVFKGSVNTGIRQVTLPTGASATLQAGTQDAAGTDVWIDVPDGALVGPTSVTMNAAPNQAYRLSAMVGGPCWID